MKIKDFEVDNQGIIHYMIQSKFLDWVIGVFTKKSAKKIVKTGIFPATIEGYHAMCKIGFAVEPVNNFIEKKEKGEI